VNLSFGYGSVFIVPAKFRKWGEEGCNGSDLGMVESQ